MTGVRHAPFLDEGRLWSVVEREIQSGTGRINDILAKAAAGRGLAPDESAALLAPMSEESLERLCTWNGIC